MNKIFKNLKDYIETIGMGFVIYQRARRDSAERRSRELKNIRDMMYEKN